MQQRRPIGRGAGRERGQRGEAAPHAAVGGKHHEQLPRLRGEPLVGQSQQLKEGGKVGPLLRQNLRRRRPEPPLVRGAALRVRLVNGRRVHGLRGRRRRRPLRAAALVLAAAFGRTRRPRSLLLLLLPLRPPLRRGAAHDVHAIGLA